MTAYLNFLGHHGARLLSGTVVTVEQFVLSAAFALILALTFGLMRLSPVPGLRLVASVYVEFFRGTSLLIQLYWIYFALPLFGLTLGSFVAGFVALGLNLGAYGAEIVRGAFETVPRGQYEACVALNMSPMRQTMRIILPQAVLIMLPPWGNLMVELLKGTSLVALIAVADLMFEAKQINATTYQAAESFGTALIIYYLLARLIVAPGFRRLEHLMRARLGMV